MVIRVVGGVVVGEGVVCMCVGCCVWGVLWREVGFQFLCCGGVYEIWWFVVVGLYVFGFGLVQVMGSVVFCCVFYVLGDGWCFSFFKFLCVEDWSYLECLWKMLILELYFQVFGFCGFRVGFYEIYIFNKYCVVVCILRNCGVKDFWFVVFFLGGSLDFLVFKIFVLLI